MLIEYLGIEDYRVGCLHNSRGRTCRAVSDFGLRAEGCIVRVGLKDIYVLLSPKQNNLLINCRNALKLLRFIASYASFKSDLNIISDIYGVKSAVKANSVYTYICPCNISVLCSDITGTADNITAVIAQAYSDILKAVSVSATVIYPVRLNTTDVTRTGSTRGIASKSVFRHRIYLLVFGNENSFL